MAPTKKQKISLPGDNAKEKELDESMGTEFGKVGTDIFSGYIDADYNTAFKDIPKLVETVDEMLGSDASTESVLDALKAPILSSKFYWEPVSEDKEEVEIAEFLNNAMRGIEGGFMAFLEEALTQYDYGFSVFEKVFKTKGNQILWQRFSPRIQKSILKWEIAGKEWTDGHPAGITQIINGTDDAKDINASSKVEIPWEKLIIFTHKKRGNNFQGRSVLRGAYIHWKMKNLFYKISAISAERFGVGVPYIKHKSGIGEKLMNKYIEIVKNIKSNEKAYAVFDSNVEDFGIMTPSGGGSEKSMMQDLVNHHDRKIYDSILAGFLNLTTGEGGSNALAEDLSSFFLRSLQGKVDALCHVLSCHGKELVELNYGEREKYAKLKCSDIGQLSMDEYVNSLKAAVDGGLIQWLSRDEDKMREQLKMPALPPEDEEDQKTKGLENELMDVEGEIEAFKAENPEFGAPQPPEVGAPAEEPKPEEVEQAMEEVVDEIDKMYFAGKPISGDTKKKISEALKNWWASHGGSSANASGVADEMAKNDASIGVENNVIAREQKLLDNINNSVTALKTKLEDYKAKSRTLDKEAKKAFNASVKKSIEVAQKMLAGLRSMAKVKKENIKGSKSRIKTTKDKIKEQVKEALVKPKQLTPEQKSKEEAQRKSILENLSEMSNDAIEDERFANLEYQIKVLEMVLEMLTGNAEPTTEGLDTAMSEIEETWKFTPRVPASAETKQKISIAMKAYWASIKATGAIGSGKFKSAVKSEIDGAKTVIADTKSKQGALSVGAKKTINDKLKDTVTAVKSKIVSASKAVSDASGAVSKKIDDLLEDLFTKYEPKGIIPDVESQLEKDAKEKQRIIDAIDKGKYSDKPWLDIPERERAFMKNIRDFENYLESEFHNYDLLITEAEDSLRPKVVKLYEKSEVELIDGVRCLAFSKKNQELQKTGLAMIKVFAEHLDKKMVDSGIQTRLFNNAKRMAVASVRANKSLLQEEIDVNEGQFNSFVNGYISNVQGVIFNEPRRISESIILNYGSQVSVDLAVKQASGMTINRNILKLSTITHARGAYQAIQYGNAVNQGFTMFKTVVPVHKVKELDPSGMTASMLFLILTAAEINRRASKETDGKTSEAVNGLNLHHGAFMYYYPIASEDLEKERALSKAQRERFFENNQETEE